MSTEIEGRHFDTIVVGGGTAGAILAARLSERAGESVLLLEAGPDFPDPALLPEPLAQGALPVLKGFHWDVQARRDAGHRGLPARVARVLAIAGRHAGRQDEDPAGATLAYPAAKVMGGGSAVNGTLALHPSPHDFDGWVALGNDAWSWNQVAPWLARLADGDAARVALALECPAVEERTNLQAAFAAACAAQGFLELDGDGGWQPGLRPVPRMTRGGRRISTASLYLAPARGRPNLHVAPACVVESLIWTGDRTRPRAAGVQARHRGRRIHLHAGTVVLAAGALHSPAILMRSGIGDAAMLERLGIDPVLDLRGVGLGLADHPVVVLAGHARSGSYVEGEPVHQLMLQACSRRNGLSDLQLMMFGAVPPGDLLRQAADGPYGAGIGVMLASPRARGAVTLASADPARSPRVALNLLGDQADEDAMLAGVRLAWSLLDQPALRAEVQHVALWDRSVIDDDEALRAALRATVHPAWHPVGTLSMGADPTRGAVVTQSGRLHGCDNVIVGDASIMPTIPSVPPNLTCMMLAERIACMLIS